MSGAEDCTLACTEGHTYDVECVLYVAPIVHGAACNNGLPMPDDRTYECHGECMTAPPPAATPPLEPAGHDLRRRPHFAGSSMTCGYCIELGWRPTPAPGVSGETREALTTFLFNEGVTCGPDYATFDIYRCAQIADRLITAFPVLAALAPGPDTATVVCHNCAGTGHVERDGITYPCGSCRGWGRMTRPDTALIWCDDCQDSFPPGHRGPDTARDGDESACTCTMVKGQTHLEPAEWEQADDCPQHPLAAVDWRYWHAMYTAAYDRGDNLASERDDLKAAVEGLTDGRWDHSWDCSAQSDSKPGEADPDCDCWLRAIRALLTPPDAGRDVGEER